MPAAPYQLVGILCLGTEKGETGVDLVPELVARVLTKYSTL